TCSNPSATRIATRLSDAFCGMAVFLLKSDCFAAAARRAPPPREARLFADSLLGFAARLLRVAFDLISSALGLEVPVLRGFSSGFLDVSGCVLGDALGLVSGS